MARKPLDGFLQSLIEQAQLRGGLVATFARDGVLTSSPFTGMNIRSASPKAIVQATPNAGMLQPLKDACRAIVDHVRSLSRLARRNLS